jgi:hypothetical protein
VIDIVSKFTKKLERELKTNPKKAVILGGLVLVAMYFWAPLVSGWLGQKKPDVKVVASGKVGSAPVTTQTIAAAPPMATAPQPATAIGWRALAEWIEKDARMQSAAVEAAMRDPLQPVGKEPDEKEEKSDAPLIVDVSPESLGVVLSSTLVGSHKSVAQIGGKTYRVGERVSAGKDDQNLYFVLRMVGPRFVVLERQGKSYTVRMATPTATASLKNAHANFTTSANDAAVEEDNSETETAEN